MSEPGPLSLDCAEVEAAFAAEAAAHARAALELNPFVEAESIELGRGRLVYAGTFSPAHGAYALGLDGPLEERDWAEIHRFFQRKEREPTFWIAPVTDLSVIEGIARTHREAARFAVHGVALNAEAPAAGSEAPGTSAPEHGAWALAFSPRENPGRREPDLLALTKMHQKETRFYLHEGAASYTFFHRGLAIVP